MGCLFGEAVNRFGIYMYVCMIRAMLNINCLKNCDMLLHIMLALVCKCKLNMILVVEIKIVIRYIYPFSSDKMTITNSLDWIQLATIVQSRKAQFYFEVHYVKKWMIVYPYSYRLVRAAVSVVAS